jgi:3-deoxy-D-manno-octulosonic-acid transferase
MLRRLYSLLMTLLTPLFLLHTLKKSYQEPRYRHNLRERLGFAPQLSSCVWIHCVSLGETIAAKPLILKLQQQFPNESLVITNTTATGSHAAQQLLRKSDHAVFLPYDSPGPVRRFLERTHPRIAILMETELWPNLIAQTHKRDIPVVLNNARLSARSQRGYQRIAKITRDMLQKLTLVHAQTLADKNRLIELGLPENRCEVTGNLKFDLTLPENLIINANALKERWNHRLTWIAASTHAGEEEIILNAHQTLLTRYPNLLLVLVPRHPNRFEAVYELCREKGFLTARHTEDNIDGLHTVLIGNTVGQLLLFYQATDITFMGGSLVSVGGHNFIESAILGKPQISGPNLDNFSWVAEQLLEHEALTIIHNAHELIDTVSGLLENKAKRKEQGDQARVMALKHAGACQKQLNGILGIMEKNSESRES